MHAVLGNSGARAFRVAVVGSGPSGFYTTKYLLKALPGAHVSMFERLPTPFGLVRSGVAPDHPEVKNVVNDFSEVARDERVRFLGNCSPSVELLRRSFDAVVLATGAEADRRLGVLGEDLRGVHAAREFVGWYNGHPAHAELAPDLTAHDTAVVVGNGNVALDCARVLAKRPEELAGTDVPEFVLQALHESRIRRVVVAGRRGHVQAAFTMKELRELTRLDAAALLVRLEELDAGATAASAEEIQQHRAKKRIDQLLRKSVGAADAGAERSVELRFLQSPSYFFAAEDDRARLGGVALMRNRLVGAANEQRVESTGELEEIECGLALRSVGYRAEPIEGVAFDEARGVARHERGRVEPGLYCAGWLKRGPAGIIGSNIQDAKETVAAIVEDRPLLTRNSAPLALPDNVVTWEGWERIAAEEERRGRKLVSVEEMLGIALGE